MKAGTKKTVEDICEGEVVYLPNVGMCRIQEILIDEPYEDDLHVLAWDITCGAHVARMATVRRKLPSDSIISRLRAAVHSRLVQGKVYVNESEDGRIHWQNYNN